MAENSSINIPKSQIATNGANSNITSLTAISGVLQAPTGINDTNSNEYLTFTSAASAAINVELMNAATGNPPQIDPLGGSGNVPVRLFTKGSGNYVFLSPTSSSVFNINALSNTNSFTATLDIPTLTADQTLDLNDINVGLVQPNTVTDSITAHAGGGQANAVLLTTTINRVTTVTSVADSIKLPLLGAAIFYVFYIRNDGANSLNLYPNTGAAISNLGVNNPLAMAAGSQVIVVSFSATLWLTMSAS